MKSALPLVHHGEHVKPHYVPAPGEVDNWAGKSTDEERPDGNTSGIVKRYDKGAKASEMAASLGLISRASSDAVLYSSPAEIGLRGLAMISGLFALGLIPVLVPYTWDTIMWGDWVGMVFGSLSTVGFILAGFTIFIWTARLELFQPIDQPTIFDRKHRKVYRVFCETQPGWKGLFKPWLSTSSSTTGRRGRPRA